MPDNCTLISFDITNLFPNVPLEESLDILKCALVESRLPDVVVEQLYDLLRVVLQQNFFTFNNCVYVQNKGLAMGSPLSPFLAELFLNNMESKIISKMASFRHIVKWVRYVDDVFVVFRGTLEDINQFLLSLYGFHSNINFTMETEHNASLPFLDLLIKRQNSNLSFSIFRKQTATDHVIPSESSHPIQHKSASFRSYFFGS